MDPSSDNRRQQQEARLAAIADELGGDVFDHNWLEEEEGPRPDRMALSPQEAFWAQQLKEHVEAAGSNVRPLTDMEYAEFALVTEGNIDQAMERIKGMQMFREMHNVQDSVEECQRYMQLLSDLQPGALINIDVPEATGTGLVAWSWALFDPKIVLASDQNWKIMALADYYLWQVSQPTLHAVREGSYQLVDGKDMGWHNFDMELEHRWYGELLAHVPVNVKFYLVYNTNTAMNLAWSLIKPFMSKKQRDVLRLGCSCDWSDPSATLRDVFVQPSLEAATARLVERAGRLLGLRYGNMEEFKLPQPVDERRAAASARPSDTAGT